MDAEFTLVSLVPITGGLMIIHKLTIENFRCFENKEFILNPHFNLVVGVNGTGKTALLDALSVSIETVFIGFRNRMDRKSISEHDARLEYIRSGNQLKNAAQWPVNIKAYGQAFESEPFEWIRSKESDKGKTRYGEAGRLVDFAKLADEQFRNNEPVTLPLISYYGTMRLWQEPKGLKAQSTITDPLDVTKKEQLSRLEGYRFSVDPRISTRNLIKWFARQAWIEFQKKTGESDASRIVKEAILKCVDGASELFFDSESGELMVVIEEQGIQPFANLSDGQRTMLALVGDIAQKAILLNPQLESNFLKETPGIVLIDELDLHLHPQWQRNLIENLRTTFPKIQFICTTHSPFLIQSLRSGEELIMLDGLPTAQVANKPIGDIAQIIMGVPNTQVSPRYNEMKGVAREYLEDLEEEGTAAERAEAYKARLADSTAPYADNPAFQAFLEMSRIDKLGE